MKGEKKRNLTIKTQKKKQFLKKHFREGPKIQVQEQKTQKKMFQKEYKTMMKGSKS